TMEDSRHSIHKLLSPQRIGSNRYRGIAMDEKQISRITQKATEWVQFQEELQRSANRQASDLPARTREKPWKEIINYYLLENWATGSPAFLILRFLQNTRLKDLGKEKEPDFLTQAYSKVKQTSK